MSRPGFLYVACSASPAPARAELEDVVRRHRVPLHVHSAEPFMLPQTIPSFLHALDQPVVADTWGRHQAALARADTVVLIEQGVPEGWALMELGYAAGFTAAAADDTGLVPKRTAVVLGDRPRPWSAWHMVDYLAPSIGDLLGWLDLEDDPEPEDLVA